MWLCHYCRFPLPAEVQRRNRLCPNCNSDIKSCMNCTQYDENLSAKCKEPESPWVSDRAAQNTCPYFEFRSSGSLASQAISKDGSSEAEEAKRAFRALFRS